MPSLRRTAPARAMILMLLTALLPVTANAGPDKNAPRRTAGQYRLFAGNIGAITINRLYYGLATSGLVGVDSLGSSTIGGGFWPKGTGNQYMFNSGLQVAGIIAGEKPANPWGGDTASALFFDATGLFPQTTSVTELYNATSPLDQANWPQGAFVPQGDGSEEIFDPLLRGRLTASQGDVWFMATETDPGLNSGRTHPLGIVAEYRVMGWNYPTGNEDLVYLVLTFYNVTSLNEADYAEYRPGIRELLIEQAQQFHALNNAQFDIELPTTGYTIDPFYAAFAADPDVTTSAATNFSSVNMPFAMGYAYHADFPRAQGWTFSPDIFGAPFFAGSGFVGVKYLKSATGPGEINLFSNTCNACGSFNDPNSSPRLYKYLSGTITPADGVSCNQGDVAQTRICWIRDAAPTDVRFLQSSSPVALGPGESASIVVAYIHAAPVQIPGYVGGSRALPDDPTRLTDPARLTVGANRIDSLMGFNGYTDANGDGIVQQDEIRVVRRSLLDKALTAQSIFDAKFLLPFAPEPPEFFLIPGDGRVTVVWRPSATESEGDPYFQVAKDASIVPEGGGTPVPNALYDANYRQFDVEGYRIYRGRADTPTSLSLLAQYDYSGTVFPDFTGQVVSDARGARCAPELGVTSTCPNVFDTPAPGVQLTRNVAYDLNGAFVQVQVGNRTLLASGDVINLTTDTAVTGGGATAPTLSNTGVPFIFVDDEPRNGLTYFYAVTAFDVNSINSTGAGNTSLESPRITKRISPGTRAGNYVNEGSATIDGIYGRGVKLTDTEEMTIDPATGLFNKQPPPANAWDGAITGLVTALLQGSGQVSVRLDSIQLGDPNASVPHLYFLSAGDAGGRSTFIIPLVAAFTGDPDGTTSAARATRDWAAGSADPELAALYGGGEGYAAMLGNFTMWTPGSYFLRIYGRGCVNSAIAGSEPFNTQGSRQCSYNGPAWFSGENQTVPHPWAGNYANFNNSATEPISGFGISNVGHLDGVATLMEPVGYENINLGFRSFEGVLGGAVSAAEYKVYWGAGGTVDSVIDVTHNVPVPFTGTIGGTWGILNQSATTAAGAYDQRPTVLTHADFTCVPGLKDQAGVRSVWPCGAPTYLLSQTAIPGSIAFARNVFTDARTRAPAANAGFGMYLKGHIFLFELEGGQLPAEGTVWSMRDYTGGVAGGQGGAGQMGDGTYIYTPVPRLFSSPGAEIVFNYNVTNQLVGSSRETLAEVHTVPDPYYVTSPYEATTTTKIIKFVNLPQEATIRIYTTSGVLVRVLKHSSTAFGGETTWDVRNRNNQFVASGVYFYHVTAENGESTVGRMTIINYAQ